MGSDQEPTRLRLRGRISTTTGNTVCALVTSAVVTLLRGGHWASSARFCAEKVTCIVLVPTTPWGGEIVPIVRMRKLRLDEVDGLGSRSE